MDTQVVGLDADGIKSTQGKLTACSDLEPKLKELNIARTDLVDKITKKDEALRELRQLAQHSKGDKKELDEFRAEVQNLQTMVKEFDRQIDDLTTKHRGHAHTKDLLKSDLNSAEADKSSKQKEYSRTTQSKTALEGELNQLSNRLQKDKKAQDSLHNKVGEKEAEVENRKKESTTLKEELVKTKERETQQDKDLRAKLKEVNSLREQIRQVEKVLSDELSIRKKFEDAQKAITEAERFQERWMQDAEDLDEGLSRAVGSDDISPCSKAALETKIGEYITSLKQKLAALKSQLVTSEVENTKLEAAWEKSTKEKRTLTEKHYTAELAQGDAERELKLLQSQLSNALADVDRSQGNVHDKQESIDKHDTSLASIDGEITDIVVRIDKFKIQLTKVDQDFRAYEENKQKLSKQSQDTLVDLDRKLDTMERSISDRQRNFQKFNEMKVCPYTLPFPLLSQLCTF